MRSFLSFKKTHTLGLDIQSDEIRLVELSHAKQKITLDNFAIKKLSQGAISDGKIIRFDEVVNTLEFLKSQVKHQRAAISLPSRSVITKRIQFPKELSLQECEAEIANHLDEYFPGVNEALCFDFSLLKENEEGHHVLLLVASRLEQLNSYVAAMHAGGFDVALVDVHSFALARALNARDASLNETLAVLDASIESAQLIVFHKKEIIFFQHINVNFRDELKRALQLYFSTHLTIPIDKIIVTGTISLHLRESLSKELNISIECMDPFFSLRVSPLIDTKKLFEAAPRLWVSYGLALRGLKT